MTTVDSSKHASLSSGRWWAWAPALILGGLLGAQLIVLSQVLHDPGFAIERDYYQKAVDWDSARAREQKSRELGWRAKCGVTPPSASKGAVFHLELEDARGGPVGGARVHVSAFHNARAGRFVELSLREVQPGVYEAELPPGKSGAWEFRISAARHAEVFEQTVRLDRSLAEGS